jgi:hypothetical protein
MTTRHVPVANRVLYVALEFSAACDPKTDGWKVSVKADGQELALETVSQATMKDGWTEIRATLPASAGKPLAVEMVMEPVKPSTGRDGPPALSIMVPRFVNR